MTKEIFLDRLERPTGRVRAVLDTDAYNEIDDQFALAYMLAKTEKFDVQAITAAPFHNEKSGGPEEGMRLSYHEIKHILSLMNREDIPAFEGATSYLTDEKTPVESPAANELVRLAKLHGQMGPHSQNAREADDPLYIIAIGAITNVASALLLDPGMAERCVIVWLGGHAWPWEDTREFNMQQDVAAARVVFNSGAPVIQLPCMGVVSHLTTTGPELDYWLRGKNKISDYLAKNVSNEVSHYASGTAWSRVIWDVSAIAWFLDDSFTSGRVAPGPVCEYDYTYSFDPARHDCKVIDYVNRDGIFTDMFKSLAGKGEFK